MSWKIVFNTKLGFLAGSHMDEVRTVVLKSGYEFFTWNGTIVSASNGLCVEGITVADLY